MHLKKRGDSANRPGAPARHRPRARDDSLPVIAVEDAPKVAFESLGGWDTPMASGPGGLTDDAIDFAIDNVTATARSQRHGRCPQISQFQRGR